MRSNTMTRPDLRGDVDAIKGDIVALQTDVTEALKHLVSVGKSEAVEVKDKLEAELKDRLDRLSQRADDLARRGKRAVQGVEGMIEEKPLQSVGIALGVGVLVGVLLSRK